MSTTVTVPLRGGPGDGHTVEAVLDASGRPPLVHDFVTGGGLDGAATYDLLPAAGPGAADVWAYQFRTADSPEQPGADFAAEHNSASFAGEMDGGPEGRREDDSPRGLAGAD